MAKVNVVAEQEHEHELGDILALGVSVDSLFIGKLGADLGQLDVDDLLLLFG